MSCRPSFLDQPLAAAAFAATRVARPAHLLDRRYQLHEQAMTWTGVADLAETMEVVAVAIARLAAAAAAAAEIEEAGVGCLGASAVCNCPEPKLLNCFVILRHAENQSDRFVLVLVAAAGADAGVEAPVAKQDHVRPCFED